MSTKPFEYRPLKTKAELISDPSKFLDDVKAYFAHCDSTREERELKNGDIRVREETPSILGLSQWLPCHINTLNRLLDDDTTQPEDKTLIDAQNQARDILAYVRQEIDLRLTRRSMDGDANDRVSAAMMARRGLIGEDKTNINLQISVAGASTSDVDEWSK